MQWYRVPDIVRVISCGLMIGTSVFYPINAIETHRYSGILLPTFSVSAIVWNVLNHEALFIVGRFTIPLGLVVLVALISGPTRAGIEAWLPLYITTVDIVTVSIWHILKQIVQANLPSPDNSNIPSTTTSDAPAQQQHRLQNSTMTRWLSEPLAPWATYILRQDTRYSPQSERSGSSMSLSSSGQARPSWGPRVLGFWLNSLTSFYSFSARYNNEVGPSDGEDLFIDVEAGSTTPLFQYEEDGVTSEP